MALKLQGHTCYFRLPLGNGRRRMQAGCRDHSQLLKGCSKEPRVAPCRVLQTEGCTRFAPRVQADGDHLVGFMESESALLSEFVPAEWESDSCPALWLRSTVQTYALLLLSSEKGFERRGRIYSVCLKALAEFRQGF